MDEREKKNLRRQLQMQADSVVHMDDKQLALSVAAVCNALLRSVSTSISIDWSEDEFGNLYAAYLAMSSYITAFFESSAQSPVAQKIRETEQAAIEQLKKEQKRAAAARQESDELKQRLEKVARENEELEEVVAKKRAGMEELQRNRQALISMEKEYSDEKLERQKEENTELLATISERKHEMDTLMKHEERLKKESENIENEIERVNIAIHEQPERNKMLLQEFETRSELLRKLQGAQENCNQKQQQELQKKIDELMPMVEKLQTDCAMLEERAKALEQQKTQYDTQKQTLSTNVLEIIERALNGLDGIVGEHRERLVKVKNKAEYLSKRVEECNRLRKEYRAWVDANGTPLEPTMNNLKQPEAVQLQETLDPGQTDTVRELLNQVQHDLNQLDGILEKCVAAVRADQKALEMRTRL